MVMTRNQKKLQSFLNKDNENNNLNSKDNTDDKSKKFNNSKVNTKILKNKKTSNKLQTFNDSIEIPINFILYISKRVKNNNVKVPFNKKKCKKDEKEDDEKEDDDDDDEKEDDEDDEDDEDEDDEDEDDEDEDDEDDEEDEDDEDEDDEDDDDEDEDDEDDYNYDEDEDDEDDYNYDELEEFFSTYTEQLKKIKNKITEMKIEEELKEKLLTILKTLNVDEKRIEWFETLTKIPFGEYSKYDINDNDINKTKDFIKNVYNNLDNSVYGMHEVKEEILNYVTQCITQPETKPRVLALCGQPGIGKTKIVRDGICKSLNKTMKSFSMGGIKDSSTFIGFDYTYVGSKHGSIVQALIDSKTMNPILFFDELDKISKTKEGIDIENLLIHLTDPVQNYDFNDKYFNGIPIDISKCLFIFSFNNIENISPILKDRLHIINIPNPSIKDKIIIAKNYFVKEFINSFKFKEDELTFNDEILKYIIEKYTNNENGVRSLKRCIETICMKLNTTKLLGTSIKDLKISTSKINLEFPLILTREHINVLLNINENKNENIPFMYI